MATTRAITGNAAIGPLGVSRLSDPLRLVVSMVADPSTNGLPPSGPSAISPGLLCCTAFGDMVRPIAIEMEDRRPKTVDLAPSIALISTGASCSTPLDLAGEIPPRPWLENIGDKRQRPPTVCSETKELGLAVHVVVVDETQDGRYNDLVARFIPTVVVRRNIRSSTVVVHPLA